MKTVTNTLPNTQWSHDEPSSSRNQSTDKPMMFTRSRSRTTKRTLPDSQQVYDLPSLLSKRSPPQARDSPEPMEQILPSIIIPGMPNLIRTDLAALVAEAEARTEAMADST